MKRILITSGLLIILFIGGFVAKSSLNQDGNGKFHKSIKPSDDFADIHDGDIIFQSSKAGQSYAIQLATHSKYSHCGIIFKDGNEYKVLEAVQPVSEASLKNWIARGDDGHFVIKRLKEADKVLNADVITKMKNVGKEFTGKDYDSYFEWSDKEIYCSELVWKIYKRAAGLEIGSPQKLSEFDLTSEIVKKELAKRYGSNIPLNEMVISPGRIFDSELLVTVKSN